MTPHPLVLFLLLAGMAGASACTEEYEAVFGDPVAGAHRRWLAEDQTECEHGDGEACARMADRYRDGSEVAKDPARATALLRKACDYGDRKSCNTLAQQLAGGGAEGGGIRPDPAEAGRIFERLCGRGDPVGCYNRAVMYIDGQGERQSYQAAVPWLKKACTPTYRKGCDTLRELDEKQLVRRDIGRFGSGVPPRGSTLATSRAAYAVALRRWFPDEIRLPVPYGSREVPTSPRNLCSPSGVEMHPAGDSLIVVGQLAIAALPAGLSVPSGSARKGKYELSAAAYLVSAEGQVRWSGQVASPQRGTWADERGEAGVPLSVMIPTPEASGDSLVILLSGDPIAVSRADAGGAVILGTYVRALRP
jgi:Sel1 repeat